MTTVRHLKSPLTWAGLVLLAVLCCAQLAAFIWFARRYPITPFSDFEGYWNEAGTLAEFQGINIGDASILKPLTSRGAVPK